MSTLLDAIRGASSEDLTAISTRIDELENELAALKLVKKVLVARFNGTVVKLAKKKAVASGENRSPPVQSRDMQAKREAAGRYLILHGAQPGPKLAAAIGAEGTAIYHIVNHPWFSKSEQGYHITPEGRQAIG